VVKSPNFYDLNMNGMSMVYEYQNFMLEKMWKLDPKCGNEQISGPYISGQITKEEVVEICPDFLHNYVNLQSLS
jgi:hypothetical protein